MTKIIDYIIEQRGGHYIHALELSSAYEYECVIESLIGELGEQFTQDDFIGFFSSIELYYYYDPDDYDDCDKLSDEQQAQDETELYNFDYIQFINDCY